MMFYGCDPDMHLITVAGLDDNLENPILLVLKVPRELKGFKCVSHACNSLLVAGGSSEDCDPVMVECQRHLPYVKARKQDIINLAGMSGALGAWFSFCGYHTEFVMPNRWKGSIQKRMHHLGICRKLGWEFDASRKTALVPDVPGLIVLDETGEERKPPTTTEWADALDSFGLAIFCRTYHHAKVKPPLL